MISKFDQLYPVVKKEEKIGATLGNKSNVVSGETLRDIQSKTLNETKDFLSKTFGPMGSNTKIITGAAQQDISSVYSKDGLKVLSKLINSGPIEASIVEELIEITRHVEKEVGDGTTSTVILSALIFDRLRRIEKAENIPPYELMRRFDTVVDMIKEEIKSHTQEITLDHIYNIAMISTNGNERVSNDIKNIYEKFGFNVDLNVGISTDENTMIKEYDGLTITEGYSDPVYINNKEENTSEIHNAKIYHFSDPVDNFQMVSLFEAIIDNNIYQQLNQNKAPIPTVIVCPKISRDTSAILKKLVNQLYGFDAQDAQNAKPPILIVTNVVASDEIIMDDIANLCGCKSITKYIDKELYKKDVEAGNAATVETISEFAGEAELVVADGKKTKFINPKHMINSETGEKDPKYTAMVNFLETEISNASDKNANELGLLKKRLSALKANLVDYLVGGITISDRDAKKDLAEDAIKNCKSAALYGVGYAANFEGLRAAYDICQKDIEHKEIAECILASYEEASKILYSTVSTNRAEEAVENSIKNGKPFNISSGLEESLSDNSSGNTVLCSIMLDINILETISKIITMMVTCNQCLLQAPQLNTYE